MQKHFRKISLVGTVFALAFAGTSSVMALPAQANVHAQASGTATSTGVDQTTTGSTNGQAHLTAARLRACQNRETAINNIMTRIDTRGQNQLTLFGTIATRVENFYTQKGKTLSNYDQLVATVNDAAMKANTDLSTLKTNSTFSCSANDPKGMVTAFQGYLKTEISDLQGYRTAVKNLIVGVAKAQGVTLSATNSTNQATTTEGQ